ncbi:MAG TPA: excinuclease ABC subunit UvrC [Alphaproteobacteria bacterium]|nr:excinuclease ABC subunit UvrC [Alphaproteobacteria bacterium]
MTETEKPQDLTKKASMDLPALAQGAGVIAGFLKTLSDSPGVYRMIESSGDILYVGKAKSLKKRVASYTRIEALPLRLRRMVALTHTMEFIRTHTEVEALLLESNLIKKFKPRFNILMRDDKSFPYILIATDHPTPRLTRHRGARKVTGRYFGPFASALDVNRTLVALQRAFMIRTCSNGVFENRTRPCLEYHIKRCTAPCTGLVTPEAYQAQVDDALRFLSGKSRDVQADLAQSMQEASDALDFETAARLRDRIKALTSIQGRQTVNVPDLGDADAFGLVTENGRTSLQVFFFRAGQNFGNRPYFPRHAPEDPPEAILSAFLAQFYENKPVPPLVLLSHPPADRDLLEEALTRRAGQRVHLSVPERGVKKDLMDQILANARDSLHRETLARMKDAALGQSLSALLGLPAPPQRIEVYDNSHLGGTGMVGAMIVAGPEGFQKSAYRKFNIREAGKSDDYGMMREVLRRRFAPRKADDAHRESVRPDLLLIDGGAGQISAVWETLDSLALDPAPIVMGIAKGPERNAGRETFFVRGRDPFQLPPDDPVLHYLQRLRDEAHRFAIGAQRTRRKSALGESILDSVPGIGSSRKKALLRHFGSAQAVASAGLDDLEKVVGISGEIARRIYAHFHET